MRSIRILVNDLALRDELLLHDPSSEMRLVPEATEEGFGESLYPILVETGVLALPTSVAAGLLATWLYDAWKRRGSPKDEVIGIEQNDLQNTISLSDNDVERIAQRLQELLEQAKASEDDQS